MQLRRGEQGTRRPLPIPPLSRACDRHDWLRLAHRRYRAGEVQTYKTISMLYTILYHPLLDRAFDHGLCVLLILRSL